MRHWIEAARPRTLPLSLSAIVMGNFLAAAQGQFNVLIFGLACLTTALLQILSNLANDYGDSIHGADSKFRQGPSRAVQTGKISPQAMLRAVLVVAALTLVSGLALVWVSLGDKPMLAMGFVGLGIGAIAAAYFYTNGPKPYGYIGLGDISVFVFFGLVGVCGSYYLQTQTMAWVVLLPAAACGFLAVGVLNINNIRDIESDKLAGKISIPVRIGRKAAVLYHLVLLAAAMICALLYAILRGTSWPSYMFILAFPLLIFNGYAVATRSQLDSLLKQLALSTLAFALLFGVGQVM